MSALETTAKIVIAMVGVLTLLHPQHNGANLNKLERDLVDKLSTTLVYQSTDKGYGGMVEDITIYALCSTPPWVPRPDLGPHRSIDSVNNMAGQVNELVQ